MICPECLLPDPYDGYGDGIGSCDCPSCETCGAADPVGWCCMDKDDGPDWSDLEDL